MTTLRPNQVQPWWRKRTIVTPPETRDEWVRLITWELWMGLILFLLVAIGMRLVTMSAFSAFFGFMMLAIALWMMWSLWSAAEPAPIADDFLRLLSDSFARDWRDPRTWPWSRVWWAYGFTMLGVALGLAATLAAVVVLSSLPSAARPPNPRVETMQIFRVGE